MNQQVQTLEVQSLWISQAISILMGVAMVAYFLAEVLKAGVEVFKK